jgi:NitT/TauT family transport system substrate-binding protein
MKQVSRRIVLGGVFLGSLGVSGFGWSVPPARAQSPTQVRVGYVPVIGASSLYVLDRAGWARDAGLDLKLVRFDSGPAAIQGLASGTLDLLAIGVAPVAVARAKGLDVKIVSAAGSGGSGFIANGPLAAAFANGASPAAAFAAFRASSGRKAKLATLPPGGVPTVALHHWLWVVGKVNRDDVEIVSMGIDAVQQAMLSGSVDGATVLEPSASIVLGRNPKFKMLVTARDMFTDIPGVVIAATGAFEKASPKALDKVVELVARATQLIRSKPAEAAGYVEAVLGGGLVDAATMQKALTSPAVDFISDIRLIEEPTRALLAYQVEIGDFATAPSTDGLFETVYSDRAVKALAKAP